MVCDNTYNIPGPGAKARPSAAAIKSIQVFKSNS